MQIGDQIRIVKCGACPKVIGKVATIIKVNTIDGDITFGNAEHCQDISSVEVKFGRGRPQKDRPATYNIDEVCLMDETNDVALVEPEQNG